MLFHRVQISYRFCRVLKCLVLGRGGFRFNSSGFRLSLGVCIFCVIGFFCSGFLRLSQGFERVPVVSIEWGFIVLFWVLY